MNKSNLRLVNDPKKEVVMHKTNQESTFKDVGGSKKITNLLTENNLQHTKNEVIEDVNQLSGNEFQEESIHSISGTRKESSELHDISNPPNFPFSLYTTLPDFIKRVITHADSDDEKDILLLGSLVATGACLSKVHGFYHEMSLHPNLYMFLTANASAGKGRLSFCKKLVEPIHKLKRAQTAKEKEEYKKAISTIKKDKEGKQEYPDKPTEKMLFIPANSSSTGVYQILEENNSTGLIFETEGDVLSNAFRSEHGNYSAGFRQAFHHETISYHRRTNDEYKEIENPKLSAILSGTPMQIQTLIPNAEDGLFSRFIFYKVKLKTEWIDVFANKTKGGLDAYFNNLGNEFLEMYNRVENTDGIEFKFTEEQKRKFQEFFSKSSKKYVALQGLDFLSVFRRSGVIFFRVAMILSFFRAIEKNKDLNSIVCEDIDFNNSMSIIKVLIQHSGSVFSQTPKAPKPRMVKTQQQSFLEKLPKSFNRKDYLEVAEELNINQKAADKLITKLTKSNWVQRQKHNCYINLSKVESKETGII